ncbi:hypothetical protein [Sedimenticola sp.]|uniref:hypothetical protein n=1 Tax=Sedimenticola sp. TaxID=1940285 RepID=UPI003D10F840
MLDHVFCERILGLETPWYIAKTKLDIEQQRVDIWVGEREKGGWLKQTLTGKTATEEEIWQYLGLGGFRTYIHASISDSRAHTAAYPWLGKKGMPFTHALTKRVLEMLGERMGYSVVCSLLNVDLQDVWRLKHSLDIGMPRTDTPQPNNPPKESRGTTETLSTGPSSHIPPVEDPIWHKVISNETEVDIRQLGLKLLISRVRNQYINTDSDEVRALRKSELRKYFVRHERSLQHELQQISTL